MVYDIESSDRRIKSDIRLGQSSADQVLPPVAKNLLQPVQTLEQGVNSFLVSLGAGSESGLVDSVVDSVVNPFVEFIDLSSKFFGVEIKLRLVLWQLVVESLDEMRGLMLAMS